MNAQTQSMSRQKAWVMAARPQTLPAAAAPVLVGTGVAIHDGVFAPFPALAALIGAALIQIGTNFANDYYDAIKGADTADREGFTRVTAGGLIDPPAVKRAMYLTFTLAVLVGVTLVWVGGVPILIIGILSVGSGIAYTGGPYPLGYHGLGDVFVFVFFGLIAVTGTYYVQAAALTAGAFPLWIPAETVSLTALVASLPIAALSTNILVVNNVRDRDEDATTGKRTLAVRYGYTFARAEFIILIILAYSIPLWFLSHPAYTLAVGIPLVTVPIALVITHTICTETAGDVLNPTLERVGKLLAGYALLFSIGLAIETLPVI